MKMDDLQTAIRRTRDYAKKYGQKLNKNQLFFRLISEKAYDIPIQKSISKKSEWQNKMSLAKKLVERHLSKMDGIEMVGVTGSVAAESVEKDEDIDLMIVTKENELWWWRLYLRIYIWWHRIPHRRFGEGEKKNEFCFNLWLDRANLTIPHEKRNLKNATDLVIMKIIFDRNNCYWQFLRENEWVKKYLATGYEQRKRETRNQKLETRIIKGETKNNFFKIIINRFLFWWQYLYMWSKQGHKLKNVGVGRAFFHKGS